MNNPIPQCSPDSVEWAFRAVEMINELQDRYSILVEAVAWERETYIFWNFERTYTRSASEESLNSMLAARSEVDRILGEVE